MAAAKPDNAKAEGDSAKAAAAAGGGARGGLQAWLPLVLNLVLMPALAYLMVSFLILPKLTPTQGGEGHTEPAADSSEHAKSPATDSHASPKDAHGKSNGAKDSHGKSKPGTKTVVPLSKHVLVNVAGTMGTRYLMANVLLVGQGGDDFKELVEKHDAQLRDLASSALQTKTIADLEKPGAKNLMRAELMAIFGEVVGEGKIQEIYLPDWAIQ